MFILYIYIYVYIYIYIYIPSFVRFAVITTVLLEVKSSGMLCVLIW